MSVQSRSEESVRQLLILRHIPLFDDADAADDEPEPAGDGEAAARLLEAAGAARRLLECSDRRLEAATWLDEPDRTDEVEKRAEQRLPVPLPLLVPQPPRAAPPVAARRVEAASHSTAMAGMLLLDARMGASWPAGWLAGWDEGAERHSDDKQASHYGCTSILARSP